jgi:hypothetical protein
VGKRVGRDIFGRTTQGHLHLARFFGIIKGTNYRIYQLKVSGARITDQNNPDARRFLNSFLGD